MSDGAPNTATCAGQAGDSVPYETRERNRPDLDIAAFVERLPRLGTVLWLHRPTRDADAVSLLGRQLAVAIVGDEYARMA